MLTDCPILFSDDHLLLISKPSGLLSVPGKGPDKQDSLYFRLQQQDPNIRLVHRLDRDTSGLLVFARHIEAQRHLNRQFAEREVNKRYIALIYGHPAEESGSVNVPLRYDPTRPPMHIVDEELGSHALTHWQILSRHKGYCRVALSPVTGRSHQLRVHMQWLGHPIVGDGLYAGENDMTLSNRLCLHAESLELNHPVTGERLHFHLPAPF